MTVFARLLLVSLSSAAYLGLAALGLGSVTPFIVQPALRMLVLEFFLLVIAGLFAGGSLSAGVQEDRSNRWVVATLMILGTVDGFLPAYTDRIGFWELDGDFCRWIGVVTFGVGGALRLWPVYVLGRRFSGLVAIQANHRLVTDGIYSRIRHPSYLGLLLTTLGWGLVFRSGVGVGVTAIVALILHARIVSEEALLQAHFGAEYDRYCARSWRLLPGIY
jgi:protein-S-isoprenylcysteine O-methyltransferase Ste14